MLLRNAGGSVREREGPIRRRSARFVGAGVVVLTLAMTQVASALAEPPPNDELANATPITSFPFSDSVDMTAATVSPGDPSGCGDPTQNIWYTHSTSRNELIRWAPTSDTFRPFTNFFSEFLVGCFPGEGVTQLYAGTYSIMVSNAFDGGTGQVQVSANFEGYFVDATAITIDRFDSVDPKTGAAIITGTLSCIPGDFPIKDSAVRVFVQQLVANRAIVVGFGDVHGVECVPGGIRWSVVVVGTNGRLGPGRAEATASAEFIDTNPFFEDRDAVEGTAPIFLRASR